MGESGGGEVGFGYGSETSYRKLYTKSIPP